VSHRIRVGNTGSNCRGAQLPPVCVDTRLRRRQIVRSPHIRWHGTVARIL